MVAPIKQVVTIQPGGLIEIRSPALRPGAQAEVTVVVQESADSPMTWANFIGSGRGQFKSIEDVDAYIREIREWDDRNDRLK